MRISDCSSDVCSSDLSKLDRGGHGRARARWCRREQRLGRGTPGRRFRLAEIPVGLRRIANPSHRAQSGSQDARSRVRSEEHTSELQSLMRISYAVFCLKKKIRFRSKIKLLDSSAMLTYTILNTEHIINPTMHFPSNS